MPRSDISRTVLHQSLRPDSPLCSRVNSGKRGLKSSDRNRIREQKRAIIDSSMDIDKAFTELNPTSTHKRWDYLLGIRESGEFIIAAEVHPMNPGEVVALIEKKQAAEQYLTTQFIDGKKVRVWFWIASGKDRLSKTSVEFRKLSKARITAAGRQLVLPCNIT